MMSKKPTKAKMKSSSEVEIDAIVEKKIPMPNKIEVEIGAISKCGLWEVSCIHRDGFVNVTAIEATPQVNFGTAKITQESALVLLGA